MALHRNEKTMETEMLEICSHHGDIEVPNIDEVIAEHHD